MPTDAVEAFQHGTQFVVAKLEWRGREKKHPLKYAAESAANLAADRVILTGEAQQLAGLENDLARLNPSIRELSVYTSDASQTLQVGLAPHPALAEALAKPIADTANISIEKATLAESLIEEIGLHL